MGIIESIRRWKTRREFARYVSPELVSSLLEKAANNQLPEPKMMHFQYILVHMREADNDEIPTFITKVVDAFLDRSGTVTDIMSSLVIGYLGIPWPKYDSSEARAGLVASILTENGNAIRIAHGEGNGLVGNFGSTGRSNYGAIIPEFSAVLKKLLDAEFGTAVEIASR